MKNIRGISLLEMLVSLGLVSFMFIFIAQTVKQSQRQARKIKQELFKSSSFDHVIELIKKDLSSVSFLFDLNDNFRQNFPVKEKLKELKSDSNREKENRSSISKTLPVFMSPYFVFKGEKDDMEFVSYALTEPSSEDTELQQWMKIRYFIQDCPNLDKSTSSSSSCLMRSSNKYWSLEEERSAEELLVLFRGFQSLSFSYLTENNFTDQNWKDSWELERALLFPDFSFKFPQELPFPFRVRLEMETQKTKFVWLFNVSNTLLNSGNPFSKEFFNFSKWEQPKQPKKPARAIQ